MNVKGCGGIQIQSFGFEANFELGDNPTGSAAFGIVVQSVYW